MQFPEQKEVLIARTVNQAGVVESIAVRPSLCRIEEDVLMEQ